ncbi:MAG: aspartate/glutamate racemase family protein [Chloroflexota bacterium]
MQGDQIYGTRARIGLIVPSSNTCTEAEFNALKPPGVSVHAARMLLTHGTIEQLARMAQDTEMAAELVATARPSIIAFACTTGSLFGGPGWDEKLRERIQKIARVPATTTSTAVIKAFRELGIKKVSVGTPYNEELNKVEVDFFEAAGIKVLAMKGLDLTVEEMHQLPLERYMELAREVNKPGADAVFLSCTNLKAVPIVERLEQELGKPVFNSNIATFWDVMRQLGIKEPIKGRGRLLASI